jgi:Ca2+-binding RTX toxin-like protein
MRSILLAFVFVFPGWLYAAVQVGSGLSSTMSGRIVPGLEVDLGGEVWRGSLSTIGVNSNYYYHSSYTAILFRTWKSGSLFWGDVESGFGGGVNYAVRGFRDEGSSIEETKSDVVIGPAFFVQWQFIGPLYLKLDMLWGLRGISQLIGLNGQDVIFLSLGVRAW